MADDMSALSENNQNTDHPVPQEVKANVFVIDFKPKKGKKNKKKAKAANLQEAFLKFKRERQQEFRVDKIMKERQLSSMLEPERMLSLRMKFLETAKRYFGVPYARRYHEPGTPMYDAPLFLDCCALTRQVLRDLKEDFGFNIGLWNQAYQYDTLPITIEKEEDMKPGDLVFISAIFYNPKAKKQRHDMVHVEIWAGDGIKTVGARWQKGVVQVFDSYKFVSKSYHSMVYHFKSIDTWLRGVCRSFCPEHLWRKSKYEPGKKSIFSLQSEEPEQDEAAGGVDDDDDGSCYHDNRDAELQNASLSSEMSTIKPTVQDEITEHSAEIEIDDRTLEGLTENEFLGDSCSEVSANLNVYDKRTEENDTIVLFGVEDGEHFEESYSDTCSICDEFDSEEENCSCCHGNVDEEVCIERDYYGEISCDEDEPFDGDDKQKSKCSTTSGTGGNSGSRTSPSNPSGNNSGQPNKSLRSNRGSSGGDQNEQPNNTSYSSRTNRNKDTPLFYIGGGNGVSLIEKPLLDKGWIRTRDKQTDDYKLKWVELRSSINYHRFREGDQLVNRIPNSSLLATKVGLVTSLREYERVMDRVKGSKPPRLLRMNDFFPESYILDYRADRDAFFETFKEGETWICKPTGLNQGKGIYLVQDITELKKKYGDPEEDGPGNPPPPAQQRRKRVAPMQRLIQRYVPNPLLLNGKKFDVRVYMLIACTNPLMVFYHKGYCRLACQDYDHESKDLGRHLTNQYVQKKDPMYEEMKEETAWSMDKFNDYVNENLAEEKGLPENWIYGFFTKRMQAIMLNCTHAVRNKLQCKLGYFDLYGFDFLLDTDMKVWLLEINVNPALHVNCEALLECIPGVVSETLDLTLEIFEKSRKAKPILPLKSLKNFKLLYNGSSSQSSDMAPVSAYSIRPRSTAQTPRSTATTPRNKTTPSPVKQQPAVSPTRKKPVISPYAATEVVIKKSTSATAPRSSAS